MVHVRFLDAIKTFEGFTEKSRWDYAQHTNGFGTKALFPGESISHEEANRRFDIEIHEARRFVEKQAEGWDEGTKAALTSLTFNAGTRWATSGLGDAVRRFDVDAVRSRFLEFTKAGGEVLPGLAKRRLSEVTWIGEGLPPISPPALQSAPVAPDHSEPPSAVAMDSSSTTAVAKEHTGIVSDEKPGSPPNHFEQPQVIGDPSAARALLVSWILMSLDMDLQNANVALDRGDYSLEL